MVVPEEDLESGYVGESMEEPAMDLELDILDEEESAPTLHRRQSGGADEVTSTVTIPTPEQAMQEEAGDTPSVWEGTVIMPDVTKFKVRSYQVSGTSDYLRNDLNSSMSLVGRIPPKTAWDYIEKISKNPQKEILVLRFGPQNNDEVTAYESFFEYLSTKDRLGVVGNASKMVKDCYIMPLGKDQEVPAALLPLEGQGLPSNRPNLLLSILVRTRRQRPGDPIPMTDPVKMPNLPKLPVAATTLPPPSSAVRRAATANLPSSISNLPSVETIDDDSPYSPTEDSPQPGASPKFKPKTSQDVGGFTEKLAKLQAEVAAKRAELKRREAGSAVTSGSGPLPPPPPLNMPVYSTDVIEPNAPPASMGLDNRIANIIGSGGLAGLGGGMVDPLRGGGPIVGGGSMGPRGPPRPLPPPGPGMPGNLLGQGVGNLELAWEEERSWPQAERSWRGGRGRDFERNRGGRWEDDRRAFDDRDRRDRRDFGRRREGGGRWDHNRREREWEEDDGWRGQGGGRREERRGGQGSRRSRERSRERKRVNDRGADPSAGGFEDWSDGEVKEEEGERRGEEVKVQEEVGIGAGREKELMTGVLILLLKALKTGVMEKCLTEETPFPSICLCPQRR